MAAALFPHGLGELGEALFWAKSEGAVRCHAITSCRGQCSCPDLRHARLTADFGAMIYDESRGDRVDHDV